MPPGGSLRLIVRRGRPEPERGAGSETKRVRFPTQMSECYPLPGLSRAPRPARSPTLTRLLTLTISLLEFSTQQNNSRLPQTSLLLYSHRTHITSSVAARLPGLMVVAYRSGCLTHSHTYLTTPGIARALCSLDRTHLIESQLTSTSETTRSGNITNW